MNYFLDLSKSSCSRNSKIPNPIVTDETRQLPTRPFINSSDNHCALLFSLHYYHTNDQNWSREATLAILIGWLNCVPTRVTSTVTIFDHQSNYVHVCLVFIRNKKIIFIKKTLFSVTKNKSSVEITFNSKTS